VRIEKSKDSFASTNPSTIDLDPTSGVKSFPSTLSAESTPALLADGFTVSASLRQGISSLLLVRRIGNHRFSSLSYSQGHDSTITIVYPGAPAVITIKSNTLPYVTLTWTSEDSLVAAGHDCQPVLFSGTAEKWAALGSLDDVTGGASARSSILSAQPTGASGASRSGVGRLNNAAFNRFKEADSRGTPTGSSAPGTPFSPGGPNFAGGLLGSASGSGASELLTVHQNTITSVRPFEVSSSGTVTKVSTSGGDGRLVVWSVSAAAGLAPKLASIQLR